MPLSLYFHIPFCKQRCAYCDFNTYAGQEALIPVYVDTLCREIETVARSAPERLTAHTLFFGGGTPSLLTPSQFERILQTIRTSFNLIPSGTSESSETSLEANPGTLTLDSLRALHRIGFNRLSLGVQSANEDELRLLGRIHTFPEVVRSVEGARRAGFDNLNLDLIFGLPEQSLDRWQATVQAAVDLAPEHLSLYALTIEHGTPFGRWAARGLLPLPDPDLAADMYEWASEFLEAKGYSQYEISNWAKSNAECKMMNAESPVPDSSFIIHHSSFECQHNLQYWRNQPYLGFGAGAHGYAAGIRYSNVLRIKTYFERLTSLFSLPLFPLSPATVHHHKVTRRAEMQETMFTGLRLTREGVSEQGFRERFGVELQDIFGKEINELIGLGLLEYETSEVLKTSEVLHLTERGRLLGNQVFIRFVGD
jgi:oxygen-independent coproporphyrinogen III oxidase